MLAPELAGALPAARAIAAILAPRGKPLDIAVTATLGGLDVELRGAGPLSETETGALLAAADAHDLARLTNHGKLVALRRAPQIKIGEATLTLPPGAFLQATQAGEETLAARVLSATAKAQNVADLFCGVGAFALRLARRAQVKAYDMDAGALAAMRAAAHATPGLRALEGVTRDLFTRPLSASELNGFDAVVFDPPRAGAAAQAAEIARSEAPIVVAVSCHAQSFARDAAILLKGGYVIREITPHRPVPLCGACRDRGRFREVERTQIRKTASAWMKLSAPASLLRAKNVTGWSRNAEARPGSRRAELPGAQIRHRICEWSSVAGNSNDFRGLEGERHDECAYRRDIMQYRPRKRAGRHARLCLRPPQR